MGLVDWDHLLRQCEIPHGTVDVPENLESSDSKELPLGVIELLQSCPRCHRSFDAGCGCTNPSRLPYSELRLCTNLRGLPVWGSARKYLSTLELFDQARSIKDGIAYGYGYAINAWSPCNGCKRVGCDAGCGW